MHTILNFIQDCIRRGISNNDISLLTKLFLTDRNIPPEDYLLQVQEFNNKSFFDEEIIIKNYSTIYQAKLKISNENI